MTVTASAAAAPALRQPRIIVCARSGKSFEYLGYGRPPKYHPDEQKAVAKERSKAYYAKVKAGKPKGKPGRPRKVKAEAGAAA